MRATFIAAMVSAVAFANKGFGYDDAFVDTIEFPGAATLTVKNWNMLLDH